MTLQRGGSQEQEADKDSAGKLDEGEERGASFKEGAEEDKADGERIMEAVEAEEEESRFSRMFGGRKR